MLNSTLFGLWGSVSRPEALRNFNPDPGRGFGQLINIFVNLLIVIAGLYALFNFILAGYGFLSAGGDSKKVADASAKIWQSVIGLTVAAGAFVLAAIFGWLIFRDASALLNPVIPTP